MDNSFEHKNAKKHANKLTKTKLGLTLFVIFSTQLLLLTFNILPFLTTVILGALGLSSYVVLLLLSVVSLLMYMDKQIFINKRNVAILFAWFFVFALILHLSTTLNIIDQPFKNFISDTYTQKNTFGGVVLSLILYPLHYLTYTIASYVILAVILIILSCSIIINLYNAKTKPETKKQVIKKPKREPKPVKKTDYNALTDDSEYEEEKSDDNDYEDIFISDDFYDKKYSNKEPEVIKEQLPVNEKSDKAKNILGLSNEEREINRNILNNSSNIKINSYKSAEKNNISKKDYILKPKMPGEDKPVANNIKVEDIDTSGRPRRFVHVTDSSAETNKVFDNKKELSDSDRKNIEFLRNSLGGDLKRKPDKKELFVDKKSDEPAIIEESDFEYEDYINKQLYDSTVTQRNYKQKLFTDNNELITDRNKDTVSNRSFGSVDDRSNSFEIDEPINNFERVKISDDYSDNTNFNNFESSISKPNRPTMSFSDNDNVSVNTTPNTVSELKQNIKPEKPKQKRKTKYIKPTLDLLKVYESNDLTDSEDYEQKALMLEETLASFRINAKVVSVTKGPAFTRFELQMPQGIPVKRVTSYIDDIAMVLQSHGAIRVEIPIPGKNAFGVEVPNDKIATVGLKDVLESYTFQSSKPMLTFALGKDITGESKIARLDKMPHLLVAGSTGSGKSVALNTLLISLLYKASPEDLRMILIDPKRVEFTLYNGLPHMLIPDVITDPDKSIKALTWLIDEMERRFIKFSKYRVRNLEEFNETTEVQTGYEEKIPFIVLVIDELADLMSINKKEIEEKIMRIAQKSRAAGIHLVLATQRPSVDVITGVIKSNLPSRIAFAVSSFADSKTIIDQSGAEKLLGKGDMLYYPNDMPDPLRIQGAFVSNKEVEDIVEFIKEHNDADFDSEIEDAMFNKKSAGFDGGMGQDEFDPLMKDALRVIIKTGGVSISKIQRMFGLGFPRAGKIVDQMEKAGFISEQDNSRTRQVFITAQEFEEKFGEDL